MKKIDIIKTVLITSIVGVILLIVGLTSRDFEYAKKVYQVYLNGTKLGIIENKEELYALINEEQKEIKDTYHVQNVYPPNGFVIKELNTYDANITKAKNIYDAIKDKDDFTVEGYTVRIKFDEENKEDLILYVLSEDVFKNALINVITAFVDKEDFYNYIHDTQAPIEELGQIIEEMYFRETITIKPAHISVKEKIYTDEIELTQYLLFGNGDKKEKYTVKKGDTIESIATANSLNTQEFLIANPQFKGENSILTIGDKVDVTLVNPVVTLVQNVHSVSDEEQVYEKEEKYDPTKPYSFEQVTQNGITGIERITKDVEIVNGEQSQGVGKITSVTIREVQNEIVTKGGSRPSGSYVDTGGSWGWPTNRPYVITSGYGFRDGSFHNALDISGTGIGSPIYAARDGVVMETEKSCENIGYYRNQCGGTYGNHVIIEHNNGYYTMYAHMLQNVEVNEGDTVRRGQIIGYMGSSGSSTGAHLHFGVSTGYPNKSGDWLNPWSLFN